MHPGAMGWVEVGEGVVGVEMGDGGMGERAGRAGKEKGHEVWREGWGQGAVVAREEVG